MYFQPPMSGPNPRKRPAPGGAPVGSFAQTANPYQNLGPDPTMAMRWNGVDAGGINDGSAAVANPYGFPGAGTYSQNVAAPSTALARRQMNGALVAANPRANFDGSPDAWPSFAPGDGSLLPTSPNGNSNGHDNIEELEELAAKAMKEAKAKRKQIPPFVQKLSSFLDENKNVDLIRWSDKGDSFIVLDEDEFARTLIPELFKHNNYASFVRQLNMYGFHKKVGLSDNSMRASERKNKSPSEYSNPYFRRGHPNLLWLINKPKGSSKAKKGKNAEGDGDSEEEVPGDDNVTHNLGPVNVHATRALPAADSASNMKKELASLREDLSKLVVQNKQVLAALSRLQANEGQLYAHAQTIQAQHERHQNSINAILNFLANVFRKTLEDPSGAQNLNDLLATVIPNAQAPGSVVDLGDFVQQQPASPNPMGATKRARGLLMGPDHGKTSNIASPAMYGPGVNQNAQVGRVTEVLDTPEASTPSHLAQELEKYPHQSMMNIIESTNANQPPGLDLPGMMNQASTDLSDGERAQMLQNMAKSPTPATANTSTPSRSSRIPSTVSGNDLFSVSPTGNSPPPFSLSPILGAAPMPPSLDLIQAHGDDISALQRLQENNDASLHSITNRLGSLSPSGKIPGLDDHGRPFLDSNYSLYSPPQDDPLGQNFDQFLASSNDGTFDFPAGTMDDGTGSDFDFGTLDDTLDGMLGPTGYTMDGGAGLGNKGLAAEAVNSPHSNAASPTVTEEIPGDDIAAAESPSHSTKRRRMG